MALTVAAPASVASVVRSAASSAARPSAAGPSGVRAKAAAIEVAATGRLLWSRGLNTERPMASITKVMTALVVIRAGDLNRKITIPSAVVGYVRKYDASNAGLRPGDKLTAGELLYALLLPSGADAAYALAEVYGPGIPAFIAKINAAAEADGHDPDPFQQLRRSGHGRTAVLELLHRRELAHPRPRRDAIRALPLDRGPAELPDRRWIRAPRLRWRNINPLLGCYPGAIGIKPGYTGAAGQCLLFEATRNGYSVIGVTLDGPDSITDSRREPTRPAS